MFIFKLFIVTSFKDVSRTPATSIMDPLMTLVNGIHLVGGRRFASEVIRGRFSKVFISNTHRSATDTR